MSEIRSGDLTLGLVPEIGGSVAYFRKAGADLMRPLSDADRARGNVLGVAMFPMIPYANRIADNQFTFDGSTYRFEQNNPPERFNVHGTAWQLPWTERPVAEDETRLELRHARARRALQLCGVAALQALPRPAGGRDRGREPRRPADAVRLRPASLVHARPRRDAPLRCRHGLAVRHRHPAHRAAAAAARARLCQRGGAARLPGAPSATATGRARRRSAGRAASSVSASTPIRCSSTSCSIPPRRPRPCASSRRPTRSPPSPRSTRTSAATISA